MFNTKDSIEIRGINRSLKRLRKDDAERVVTGIWIAIVASVFEPKHEYMIRAQSLSPGGGYRPSWSPFYPIRKTML